MDTVRLYVLAWKTYLILSCVLLLKNMSVDVIKYFVDVDKENIIKMREAFQNV